MLADVLELLATKLATCAPSEFGASSRAFDGSPPRYLFVPRDVKDSPTNETVVPLDGGAPRELLKVDAHGVDVYCWGAAVAPAAPTVLEDMRACERLRQALLTVCEAELASCVAAYDDAGEWIAEQGNTRGVQLVVKLSISLGLPYAKIPGTLGDAIDDRVDTLALIEEVGFDPTDAVIGDGTLTAGEA